MSQSLDYQDLAKDRDNLQNGEESNPEDKIVFLEIGKICKSPQDVVRLLEKIFRDIQDKKEIRDFRVKKELRSGIGKILNDAIILEPNIAGIGVNVNSIFKFLSKK